ncbi:trifunctional serine/threonine-protein kinase/ATP-binding protein/sensor histidine kinase [Kamptonema sp. UHCC 0994]|uniref:trifunctional serine/threonine-protein kinase/ATP-binding protein/sensor histidine kinase n=1 Tax=Kamptonema sp. UHCC 0994 TaxID=3031329 RepID=UPI0023BA1257|nr:trifunctional serine/threonine-protein kinase/ATP-binding protein/sensor histidine kinase [Kamptonema sp. UHCC 0994]MDF0555158.1 AAA family ATPase [Kamptonema sp. UHCC 0994]
MDVITHLPGYLIAERIYTGSRTLVYQGVRESDRRSLIIKLLRNEYPSFNELMQFRNQYTIAKNLNFPSIVKPLTLEAYHNSYALIMEDFGGVSLSNYLKMTTDESQQYKSLTLAEFLNLALQLTDILHYLYQNRVIHKDIKPSNILINPDTKQIKLIDFSISSLLPRETQEIQNPNVLEGTLAYLSPEQTGRMNRGIDYRSDFYSLGVTFYELLTGLLPFDSEDPMELVHCHLAKQPIPLHQVKPEIPLVLSEIVSKLMAKNAEDRYQSALGLKYDLEICLDRLEKTGEIEAFGLGQGDITDRFLIPEKLYGREKEIVRLLAAFERVANPPESPLSKGGNRGVEMMLVAGFSGIGKTAVVNEVHKPIVRQRGYFIKGKYDQFQRNLPFSAFVQAFRDLIGQLLSESDAQLQTWKNQILAALGDSGQVLIDVIPELENIIGKQPPAIELSGSSAQNRFNLLFQKFVQVFTSIEHPLVMFLDDWQWADSASLNLLKLLLQDTGYLLVLGAYRDNEVSPVHPFILTVDEIIKTGTTVNTITLPPLRESEMNCLVADTLNCEFSLAKPLTKLVYQKTKGNPFFATQFLKALHDDKLISFDWDIQHWQCDIAKVNALALTDDVVEFMALQLQKLPLEAQEMLKLAACIGAEFDLNTLVIVSEKSAIVTAATLWKALQEGLVIPTTRIYKFFTQLESEEAFNSSANPTYRFLHDRVQQAAYSLISDDQKQETHLKIGHLLLKNFSELEQEEKLFDIVGHLNLGQKLITQPGELEELAQMNLKAGVKARNSTAYATARIYLQTGIELLDINCWKHQYELTLNLYVAAAEAAYLNSDFEGMEQIAALVLQNAQTIFDKIKIYEIKIAALTAQSKILEAIAVGRDALFQLGVELPTAPDEAKIAKALQTVASLQGDRGIEELVDLPVMSDACGGLRQRQTQAAMQLLGILFSPILQAMPGLMPILSATMVSLSIQFGNTPGSTVGYAIHSMVLCAFLGEVKSGYSFGRLAINLLDRLNVKELKSKVLLLFAAWVQHHQESLRATMVTMKDGYATGIETGDFLNAGYNSLNYLIAKLFAGVELDIWEPEIAAYRAVLVQIKQHSALIFLDMMQQTVQNLREGRILSDCLIGTAYDETVMLSKHHQDNDLTAIAIAYTYKLMLAYIFGNYTAALEHSVQAKQYLMAVSGMIFIPIFHFYAALTYLAIFPTKPEPEQSEILALMETHQTTLHQWAQNAPMNHLHKWYLVEAEKYRVLGNKAEAIDFYDRAIAGAKENEYLNEEAIANELAAKFYLDWGKEKIAQAYMTEAYYCYARWGAKAKVTNLEKLYPQLLAPIFEQSDRADSLKDGIPTIGFVNARGTIASTKTSSSISEVLDLATLLKASQAIFEEIELDKLLTTLLEIVIINAGASKCVLLLKQDSELKIVALLEEGELPQLLPSIPLESSRDIAISLVNNVKRTLKPLVLGDASINPQFAADSYIEKNQPKSIFCSPILNQGLLIGVLYLENNLTVGAFTSDRVELLNLLCAQAAISLENARLYRNSQNYTQELTQSLAKLQATETRFQNLANNIPGMVYQFRLGTDGSVSTPYVSSGCLDLYEVEPELVMGGKFSLYTLHHPDDNPAIEKAIAYSAQNLTPFEQEWRIILPSGTMKWIQSAARPERQADGSILWDGVVIDISDRKHIEAEQTRLLAILESTPDLIGTADPTGKNLYLNRAWRHFLGLENEVEERGTEITKYHPDWATEIIVNQGLPEAIHSGIWVGETAVIDRNGREIPVSQLILSHKSRDGELEYFSTIIRDISDRKQAESAILQKSQELEQAVEALQQAQLHIVQSEKMSALGNLVAGVAHEMNNPLGFISASLKQAKPTLSELIEHLRLYQEIVPDPNEKIIDHADEIDLDYTLEDFPKVIDSMEMACDRLKNISTSLRTFSRADRDYKVPFNIHEGIDSTILILKHRLKGNDRRPAIEVVTEYGNLPKIDCFPGQLNQVFINILANAIDALDESSIGLSFEEVKLNSSRIIIKTSLENTVVKIAIADNGMGMSESVKQKIFDHLFTTKAVGKGTGLGLAIARQIVVEKHQGQITVNSVPAEGTVFEITLPVK